MHDLNKQEDYQPYAVHLWQEHKRLDEMLRHIEERWASLRQSREPKDELLQLVKELAVLRGELRQHFAEEESGGCMEEAVARAPALGTEADRLELEHPQLLREIDTLIERVRAISPLKTSLDQGEAEFSRFVNQLRAHETAENRILETGFDVAVE